MKRSVLLSILLTHAPTVPACVATPAASAPIIKRRILRVSHSTQSITGLELVLGLRANVSFIKDFDTNMSRLDQYSAAILGAPDSILTAEQLSKRALLATKLASYGVKPSDQVSYVARNTILNDPDNVLEPNLHARIGARFKEDCVRGAFIISLDMRHEQDDDRGYQYEKKFDIYQAFVNFGAEQGWQVEAGICEGPETTAFTPDTQFFRGSSKGIFGLAGKKFRHENQSNKAYKYTPALDASGKTVYMLDAHDMTDPGGQFFFKDQMYASDEAQPRLNVYTPVANLGSKLAVRAGIGATLASNAENSILVTAGSYADYQLAEHRKVRLSLAGAISTKTESELQYQRPMGFAVGAAYLSKPFDLGLKFTYNHNSCIVANRIVPKYVRVTAPEDIRNFSQFNNDANVIDKILTHVATVNTRVIPVTNITNDEAAPLLFSLRSRISAGSDRDITFGALLSTKKLGYTIDGKSRENIIGVSAGFNMPIEGVPFRAGFDVSYIRRLGSEDAVLAQNYFPIAFVNSSDSLYNDDLRRMNVLTTKHLFQVTLGVVYAPVIDLDDDERVEEKLFEQPSSPVTVV